MTQFLHFRLLSLVGLLVVTGCNQPPRPAASVPEEQEWREFEGTWTAAGNRYVMGMGDDRKSSIVNLSGALLLTGQSKPAIGFRAEALAFNDSATGMIGRAVWTAEGGDQAFSELRGEGTATRNKVIGTFVGGTGRYAGATGSYEFSWRFVLQNEDGTVQGESVGLKGRVHVGPPQNTTHTGDLRP